MDRDELIDRVERTVGPIEYEQPKIVDYGSLLELTKSASSANADINGGPANTAFSVGH